MTNPVYADRVQETFTTTGTGTITLGGAVTGYRAFTNALADQNTCYYAATDGTNWEVGLGTFTASGTTLARTTILASSNSGSAVSWATGTKNIWLDFPAAAINPGQLAGFRNYIINGDFKIWQRGTTYALTTTVGAYGTADRWGADMQVSAAGIANQTTSPPTGFKYAMKLGRTSASALAEYIQIGQVIESTHAISLAGQTVTLSMWLKAGANFSGSSFNLNICYGTGTDEGLSSMQNSAWTGFNNSFNSAVSPTTSWVRYTYTVTIPTTATEIGINLYYLTAGTAGVDDNIYIAGVQLEPGSIATPYEFRPFGVELGLCQRYYRKSFPYATAPAQNAGVAGAVCIKNPIALGDPAEFIPFDPPMRAAPTVTTYNPSATNANWRDITASSDVTVSVDPAGALSSTGVLLATSGTVATLGDILGIHYQAVAEL
jgi:hypothetical protein